ncbi:MAG: Cysteine-rich secretory protein family protein [Microgenomates bacterium OLB23]|nr:MAG: Cysteine-rich secretory protein family protein [Microgenomates bacterium OLB23]
MPAQPTSIPASPTTLEQQILELINQRRTAAGLQTVTIDGALSTAARNHSTYMASSRVGCTHIGQNGSSPLDRAKSAGYNGQVIGETVACGYTTALGAVDGWWSSPPHKAILTSPNARQIGIGWAQNHQTALMAR